MRETRIFNWQAQLWKFHSFHRKKARVRHSRGCGLRRISHPSNVLSHRERDRGWWLIWEWIWKTTGRRSFKENAYQWIRCLKRQKSGNYWPTSKATKRVCFFYFNTKVQMSGPTNRLRERRRPNPIRSLRLNICEVEWKSKNFIVAYELITWEVNYQHPLPCKGIKKKKKLQYSS